MTTPALSDILPIVRAAGEIILRREGAAAIPTKAAQDFVTQVDLRVQRFIRDALAERWPELQFMGEEQENSHLDFTKPYWVLDPIDGTTNFIHDFPASVISLALVCDHEPLDGESAIVSTNGKFTQELRALM